jgi:ribose transport system substrate-binding protein
MKAPRSIGLTALAVAVLAAGCGSSDDSSSGADQGTGGGEALAAAKKASKEASAPIASYPGPTTGPKGVPGKHVVIVSCGMPSEGCARPVRGARDAAKAIGWESTICDGQFDPKLFNSCIEQAINQKADALFLEGITAKLVSNTLPKARERGMVVVSAEALNEPSDDGVHAEIDGKWDDQGAILANEAIVQNGTDAAVLIMEEPSYDNIAQLNNAAIEVLDKAGTPYEKFVFSEKDIATTVPEKTLAAIRANPEIEAVISFDDALLQVIPALRGAGMLDKVALLGYNAIAIDSIRKGDMRASVGQAQPWEGWAAIDNINRIFAGEEPVDHDVPIRLFTEDNVGEIEEGQPWSGDVDYQSAYRKIWAGE